MKRKNIAFFLAIMIAFLTVGMPIDFYAEDNAEGSSRENDLHTHIIEYAEAAEPTCTENGNSQYWFCKECGSMFSDEYATLGISSVPRIPPLNHRYAGGTYITEVAASGATCTEYGNDRYWTCSMCGRIFSDEQGASELTDIPKIFPTGHSYADGICSVCGAVSPWSFDETSGTLTITANEGTTEWYDYIDPSAVKQIEIGSGVTRIGDTAFCRCTEITSVVIPEGVTYLGWYSFYGCTSLETVSLPMGIAEIGMGAFDRCTNLKSLLIPSSLRTITFPIFEHCENLEAVGYYAPMRFMLAPTSSAKFTYEFNGSGGATVKIISDGGRTAVTVPDEIEGRNVIKIINNSSASIIHSHSGGGATCIDRAVCTVCSQSYGELADHIEDGGTIIKQPTESETGLKTFYCKICGIELRTETVDKLPPEHTHSYGTDWVSDGEVHWHECICGERTDAAAHISDSGVIAKQPSDTQAGVKEYHCTECGLLLNTEILEMLPPVHNHDYGSEWKFDGFGHWHECICGERDGESAHSEELITITVSNNANGTSTKIYKCAECGYTVRTETILPSDGPGTPDRTPHNPSYPAGAEASVNLQTKEPKIRNTDGKTGWDAINEEIMKTAEGGRILVDMNDTTVIPQNILYTIRGKDIDLVLEMGGGIIWTVNGKTVTAPRSVDLRVYTNDNAIPADILKGISRDGKAIQLTLAHKGSFGFTAVLTIDLGNENDGLYANMFCLTPKAEELEFTAFDLIEDGRADIELSGASSCALIIDSAPMNPYEDISAEAGLFAENEAQTSGHSSCPIGFVPAAVICIGMFVLFGFIRK